MPHHVIEPAPSGRAKCRGCGSLIARGETRFGERLANPFSEGEMTVWFHPRCAAWKRPEPLLQALAEADATVPERDALQRVADIASAHARLQRVDGAERAPTAQAKCRHCHQPIARGDWRIRLSFWEEGRFTPGGFVHLHCGGAYFETGELAEVLLHFSAGLDEAERDALARACAGPAPTD
jgi:hypothetical protein